MLDENLWFYKLILLSFSPLDLNSTLWDTQNSRGSTSAWQPFRYLQRELLSLLPNLLVSIPNCPSSYDTVSKWPAILTVHPFVRSLSTWVSQNWTNSWCVAWGSCFSPSPWSPHSLNTMGDITVGLAACSPHCQALHLVTFAFPSILLFLPFTNGVATRPSHWASRKPVWVQLS